jgi:hypothetical protein
MLEVLCMALNIIAKFPYLGSTPLYVDSRTIWLAFFRSNDSDRVRSLLMEKKNSLAAE